MLKFAIIYDLKCLISNQKIETCRQSRKYNLYTRNKQVTNYCDKNQMLDLTVKDFKISIINMLKELRKP